MALPPQHCTHGGYCARLTPSREFRGPLSSTPSVGVVGLGRGKSGALSSLQRLPPEWVKSVSSESARFGFTSCSTQSSDVSLGKLPDLSELRLCHLKARRVGAEWVKVWAPCRAQVVAGTGQTPSCSVAVPFTVLLPGEGPTVCWPSTEPRVTARGWGLVRALCGLRPCSPSSNLHRHDGRQVLCDPRFTWGGGDGAGEGTPPACARLQS